MLKQSKLPPAALQYLKERGISEKAAFKRGLRVVEGEEAVAILGMRATFLEIPYCGPDGRPLSDAQAPFVRGRILGGEGFSAGMPTKGMKFRQPKGTRNHLYLDPARGDWLEVIADPNRTLVNTEGEVKGMCATEHGLTSIAIGGVWSWKTRINGSSVPLPELDAINWTDRSVELAFDSDASSNSQVMAALHALAMELTNRGAKVTQVIIPPGDGGAKAGLDDYLVKYGAEGFAALPRAPVAVVLNPAAPLDAARAYLSGRERMHYWGGSYFCWRGDHYGEMKESELRAGIYKFLDTAKQRDRRGALAPFCPNAKKVSDVVDALRGFCHLSETFRPPCWIEQRENAPPAQDLIAMRNGLLHWPSGMLYQHGHDFFNLNSLSFGYDPCAAKPERWLQFLNQIWQGDQESIDALQEWIGYFLSGDGRQQKILLIVGPKRAGKGTISRVLLVLLGEPNVAAPTLASLSTNFGLAPLIGKSLATITDARIAGRTNQVLTERLLSISGEDTQTIDRKYGEHWTGRLGVRFLILSNEVPRIADASNALSSRFIVLKLKKSFYGKEDLELEAALSNELAAIFQWALVGLRRLRTRGRFLQPKSAKDEVELLEDLTSPVSAFLRECCEVSPHAQVKRNVLFAAWQVWCRDNGYEHTGTQEVFGRDLRAAVPGLKDGRVQQGGPRVRTYIGLQLRSNPSGQAWPGQSSSSIAKKKKY